MQVDSTFIWPSNGARLESLTRSATDDAALPAGVSGPSKGIVSIGDRVLLVPHAPSTGLRTRAGELARALASLGCEVDIFRRSVQPRGLTFSAKLKWHYTEMFSGPRTDYIEDRLCSVKFPTAHRVTLLMALTNRWTASMIRRLKYDVIISSAYSGFILRRGREKLIYDIVDDHSEGEKAAGNPAAAITADTFMKRQVDEADLLIASSRMLVEFASKRFGREAIWIPNGADVARIRRAVQRDSQTRVQVGYVGGLDKFVRIDVVVRAIERVRRKGTDVEFTIVGDGPALNGIPDLPWIHRIGPCPPDEICNYLKTFRVGVVPFSLSPFTNAALPLKVFEYGAARTITISSPLEELKRTELSWVVLAELNEVAWANALEKALQTEWRKEWDDVADLYDWKAIAKCLVRSPRPIQGQHAN